MSQITDEELTVLKVRLRLAGIHPTWIEWAQLQQASGHHYILQYMNEVCDGVKQNDYLLAEWKKPLPLLQDQ